MTLPTSNTHTTHKELKPFYCNPKLCIFAISALAITTYVFKILGVTSLVAQAFIVHPIISMAATVVVAGSLLYVGAIAAIVALIIGLLALTE